MKYILIVIILFTANSSFSQTGVDSTTYFSVNGLSLGEELIETEQVIIELQNLQNIPSDIATLVNERIKLESTSQDYNEKSQRLFFDHFRLSSAIKRKNVVETLFKSIK